MMEHVGSIVSRVLDKKIIDNDKTPEGIMKDEKIFARSGDGNEEIGVEDLEKAVDEKIKDPELAAIFKKFANTVFGDGNNEEDDRTGEKKAKEKEEVKASKDTPRKDEEKKKEKPVKTWEVITRGKNYCYKKQPLAFIPLMMILFAWSRNKPEQVTSYQPGWLADKLAKFYRINVSPRTVQNVLSWAEKKGYIRRIIRKTRAETGKVRTCATVVLLLRKGRALLSGMAKMVGRSLVWYKDVCRRFKWALRNEACEAYNGRYKDQFLIHSTRSGLLEALSIFP